MGENQEHLEKEDVTLVESHQLLQVDEEGMQAESLMGKEKDSGEVLQKRKTSIYATILEQVNKVNTLINVFNPTMHSYRKKKN